MIMEAEINGEFGTFPGSARLINVSHQVPDKFPVVAILAVEILTANVCWQDIDSDLNLLPVQGM